MTLPSFARVSLSRAAPETRHQAPPAPLRWPGTGWWLGFVIAVTAIGGYVLDGMRSTQSNGFGLISVFPLAGFACLGLLTVSFLLLLRRDPRQTGLALAHVAAAVFLVYGASPLSEKVARWSVAWYTSGFVNQVATTGQVLHHVDARWSWPGFFAGVAALMAPAGVRNADQLLLWTPVVFALAYLLPVYAIARSLTSNRRVQLLAVWVFFIADWTGQEYFSPQGLAFFLFLVVLALVLAYLRQPHPAAAGAAVGPVSPAALSDGHAETRRQRWRRQVRAASRAEPVLLAPPEDSRIPVLLVVVGIMVAMSATHQLTPVAAVADLTLLVVFRRLPSWGLPVLLGAIIFLYISYFATDFWTGHLATVLGITSGGTASLSQNVTGKIVGEQAHKLVVYERLAYTATVWVLAFVGVLRRWRRSVLDVTVLVCFLVPLSLPVVQPYGGEALIRAFLYGLPFAAVLVAVALCPTSGRASSWALLGVVLVAAIPAAIVAKYGNEQFEAMRPNEVAAYEYFYRVAPAGSTLLTPDSNVPGPYQDLTTYTYLGLQGRKPTAANVTRVLDRQRGPARYVLLTASSAADGTVNEGLPVGWENKLAAGLRRSGSYRVIFNRPSATLYELRAASPRRVRP